MNRSELELTTMGKEASAEYICNNVPLNDTILKMTKEAKLNPHQVARVCEAANINTYNELWERTKSAEFVFPLANQEEIVNSMNKVAEFSITENDVPVEQLGDLLPDIEEVETPETEVKEAFYSKVSELAEEPKLNAVSEKQLEKVASHIEQFLGELDDAIAEQELVKIGAYRGLTDMLKQAALKGEDISKAYIAARIKFPEQEQEVKDIFNKVACELKKSNITFEGSRKMAAKCIDENARGKNNTGKDYVVSGSHPVIKYINTIRDSDHLIAEGRNIKDYFTSKMECVKEHLHKHNLSEE